jgi:hypothetical protein
MTALKTLLVTGLVSVAAALPARGVTLRVDDAVAHVGDLAHVLVQLENAEDDVRGVQFALTGLPDGLQFDGVRATGRAGDLTADAHQQADDHSVRVVLISLGEQTIAAGTGPVLDLSFTVRDAVAVDHAALTPREVRVAGTDGELDATAQGGQFRFEGASQPAASGGCAIGSARSVSVVWLMLAFVGVMLRRAARFCG